MVLLSITDQGGPGMTGSSMNQAKRLAISVVAVATLFAIGSPAWAEAAWSSTLSGVLTGFNSRSWADHNIDTVKTSIQFNGCVDIDHGYVGTTATVQLTQETPWYEPDINMGVKTLNCASSDTQIWAQEPAASYHFTVVKIGGQTSGGRLDASYVRVAY